MTLYLTDSTTPDEILKAKASGFVVGAKLYPAGRDDAFGRGRDVHRQDLARAGGDGRDGLVLQVHGEVTESSVDVFDREHVFIDRVLSRIVDRVPQLKVVFEHITTRTAAQFVRAHARAWPPRSRRSTCSSIATHCSKAACARITTACRCSSASTTAQALLEAATSDDPRFFLGTDSAPHAPHAKETACGCAGIFSAHAAIELYAEAFERRGPPRSTCKPSPRSVAPISTACRATRTPSPCTRNPGTCRTAILSDPRRPARAISCWRRWLAQWPAY